MKMRSVGSTSPTVGSLSTGAQALMISLLPSLMPLKWLFEDEGTHSRLSLFLLFYHLVYLPEMRECPCCLLGEEGESFPHPLMPSSPLHRCAGPRCHMQDYAVKLTPGFYFPPCDSVHLKVFHFDVLWCYKRLVLLC